MSKVQLPGSVRFDSQIKMHTGNENKDLSLSQKFKNHLEYDTAEMVSLIKENEKRFTERKWIYR